MMFYSKAAQNIMTVTGRARDFMLEPTKKNAAQNLHNFNSVASKRCFSQLLQNVPSGKFQ